MAEELPKYLWFAAGREDLQFTCLPFGLSTPPRVFFIVVLIRTEDLCLHHYLDNLLILAQDREQLLPHRAQVISTLPEFGWLLNLEKCHLEPTQSLVYLGAQFDTAENTISLPLEKIPVVQDRVQLALASPWLRVCKCLRIISTMVSMAPWLNGLFGGYVPFKESFSDGGTEAISAFT